MPFRAFAPDRRCPHCQSAALYLEEIHSEMDIVCIVCGYRRTDALRDPPRRRDHRGVQSSLPLTARTQ